MHETTCIYTEPVQRRLAPLPQMRHYRHGCRGYYNAPDLEWVGKNGWRFVNAVSDFATHADPIRKTRNYNENLFLRTAEGNPMIDKAYKMVLAAA